MRKIVGSENPTDRRSVWVREDLYICETYYGEDCDEMKYFALAKYEMKFKQSELYKSDTTPSLAP